MKSGRSPTHPIGIHRIDADTADRINQRYSATAGKILEKVSEGDKICSSCLRNLSKTVFENDYGEVDTVTSMSVDGAEWVHYNGINEMIDNEDDTEDSVGHNQGLPSSQEQRYTKEEAKEKLNIVFELLNIPKIRDM